MKVLFDHTLFYQVYGGASKYFAMMINSLPRDTWKTTALWSCNEYVRSKHLFRTYPKKFRDFSSLRHSFMGFVVISLLSVIITCAVFVWMPTLISTFNYVWWFSLVVFVVFIYLNFIVFTFKIKNKAIAFKTKVNESKTSLIGKCQEAEKKVEDLRGLSRLNARLQSD